MNAGEKSLYELETGRRPEEVDDMIVGFLRSQDRFCAPVHRIAHELKLTRHAVLLRVTPLTRARLVRVVGLNLCLMEQAR